MIRATHRSRGLTLVETLVAVAVTGVLASVALPSYRGAQLRGQRVDATSSLQELQREQETYRERHGGYADKLEQLPGFAAGRSLQGRYRLVLQGSADGLAYTATAIADGAQAADTDCSEVTLRIDGALSFQGPDARCWQS
ncbi:type IV pilin protein [Aquabacterium humicola]|uniref:type IV pilin protein n=1 Tax=Aquabacterium humicola TaxID=3237377 RepID=UPI002542C6DD|nr:type IV pilin protein [Rubrivivax pictus]